MYSFKNPLRRPLSYKLYVEKNYEDIFCIENVETESEGNLPARAIKEFAIIFRPKYAAVYNAKMYLETSLSNFIIELKGIAVSAQIDTPNEQTDFGTGGVGNGEVRDVSTFYNY